MKRTEPVNASNQQGAYTAEVMTQFKEGIAEEPANFKIH
jgi:hypothetical protein